MAKQKTKKKNIYPCIRRKHLRKLVVNPITRCIENHARRASEEAEKIWNKVKMLEDSIDILAREFQRRAE